MLCMQYEVNMKSVDSKNGELFSKVMKRKKNEL